MATISSVFKMQDNATRTFNSVAASMSTVLDRADQVVSRTSAIEESGKKIAPSLSGAITKYQELMAKQDQVNEKIAMMSRQEKLLQSDLAKEKSAYNQNEKAIYRIEKSLMNVRNQKNSLINQSDKLTNKIYEQAEAVNKVAKNGQGIRKFIQEGEGGFSKWGARVVAINQGLQLAKTLASGAGKVLNMSDELTLTKARIDLINDGTQSTVELQNKIYQAAQRSRGAYDDMSKSVAKLGLLAGNAFKSNDEMVAFSEMMNKSFKVSGASQQEISSATYQLTQAMAAGKLQGDEFRSIMENAPMLADAIAKYMGKSKGELKELSSEGVITADIIKNALFSSADEINEKFDKMPKTFGDAMNNIKNTTQRYLQPIADKITEMLNSEQFNNILNGILEGIRIFAGAAYRSFQLVGNAINFFKNNMWLTIPILTIVGVLMISSLLTSINAVTWGLIQQAAAWLAANWQITLIVASLGIVMGIMIALKAPLEALVFIIAAIVAVIAIWHIVQWSLNTAMYACPIVWIIIGILAIIIAIMALIQWIAKIVGSTNTALGIICGAIMAAVAFIWNLFLGLLDLVLGIVNAMINPWIRFANFLANLFTDPIGAIIHLFGDMADGVLGILETIAKALDKVFGSNMAGTVKKWRGGLDKMVEKAANKHGNGSYEKVAEELNLSSDSLGLKRFEYGDAWNMGLNFGNNIQNGITDGIGGVLDSIKGLGSNMENMLGNPEDASKYGGYDMGSFIDGNGNLPVDVKKNSDKEVDISDEDLKMLKDIATREYMLNYKHVTPNVNISFGDVRETADVNSIKDELERMMEEELAELYVVEEG